MTLKKPRGGARSGAGRPKELTASRLISIDMPASLIENLDERVRALGSVGKKISRNELIREIIEKEFGIQKGSV